MQTLAYIADFIGDALLVLICIALLLGHRSANRHDRRVTELLEANNRELERRREAEAALARLREVTANELAELRRELHKATERRERATALQRLKDMAQPLRAGK